MTRAGFRRLICSIAAALSLVMMSTWPAAAATSTASGSGLRVSPVVTNLSADPGKTLSVQVFVQDVTKAPMTLQVEINDFTASNDESGEPALLLNPGQYAPTHSLKKFVAPIPNLSLLPGQQKAITVHINIPKDAGGGGYFGAVRFAPASASGGNQNVTLLASVASLILVRVSGNVVDDLKLASLEVQQGKDGASQVFFTSNKNLLSVIRFQNAGNVQEQPFGKLLLKKGNQQIASYEINNTPIRGNVLPDSIRKFTVNLDKVGSFGKYTLVGNFGYGTKGQLISGQTTFYIIPLSLIILAGIIIVLILLLIFVFPRLLRAYNRRVVQRANRRR